MCVYCVIQEGLSAADSVAPERSAKTEWTGEK